MAAKETLDPISSERYESYKPPDLKSHGFDIRKQGTLSVLHPTIPDHGLSLGCT